MLRLRTIPSLQTAVLTCTDMMCGIGAFHQAALTVNSWAAQNTQQGQAHTLQCTVAMDLQASLTAVYNANYPSTPVTTMNVTNMSLWPTVANPAHILMAGPPCQGWSPAGHLRRWNDTRSMPLAMMPLITWSWGYAAALMEQVPAFVETGLQEWTQLWALANQVLTVSRQNACTTLPTLRPRVFITTISQLVVADAHFQREDELATILLDPGLMWFPPCPFQGGVLSTQFDHPSQWEGFARTMAPPIPPARLHRYFQSELLQMAIRE